MPDHGLALVQDAWVNLTTGLGDATKDRRKAAHLQPMRLSYGEACNLYRGDKMAAKVVDMPAGEMVREWFDVVLDDDAGGRAAKVDDRLKELGAKAYFKEALISARKTGGAGILVGVDDGTTDGLQPLDPAKVKRVKYLMVCDAAELVPAAYYDDLNADNFGKPRIYRVQPRAISGGSFLDSSYRARESQGIFKNMGGIAYVHESRVLPFYGVRLSRPEMQENLGWGDTVYNRIYAAIQDFNTSFDSVAYALSDFSQGVLAMKGLAAAIAAKGASAVNARMQAANLSKGLAKLLLIDTDGETFTRTGISFASIPDTLDRICSLFAASADMPVSLLFGEAPAGLQATGDSDIRFFYDQISAKQEEDVIPPAQRLVQMLLCEGGQSAPAKWSIQCRPLWQLDETEESDRYLKTAQGDQIYANMPGGATGEEIITSRFAGPKYNPGKINLLETDPKKRALAAAEAEPEEPEPADPAKPAADKEPKDKP